MRSAFFRAGVFDAGVGFDGVDVEIDVDVDVGVDADVVADADISAASES